METLKLVWVSLFGGLFLGGVISFLAGLLAVAVWAITLDPRMVEFAGRAVIAGLVVAFIGGLFISPVIAD